MEPDPPKKPDWEHAHWQLREPDPEYDKPESPLAKWFMIAILTLIGAAVFGVVAAFGPYFATGRSTSDHHSAWEFAQNDTAGYFKLRFILGALVGAVISFIWLCRVTRDPDGKSD